MKLFDNTFTGLELGLNYASKRNQTISNNIANVDTPFYKAKDVDFNTFLHEAMTNQQMKAKKTHPKHIPFSEGEYRFQTMTNSRTTFNHNGNNVDMDKEMANLAKNQIYYRSLVDNLNGKFNTLQTVIRGGR